ncbi:MAG: anti-sigma factor [Leucothrix sp.]
MVGAMIYSQKFIQKVDIIEKQQVAQYETRALLLSQPDAININWMRTLDPMAKKVHGDIVWSTQKQQGMMRFANLPALKPDETYHLWMYDLASSASDPVSVTQFSPEFTMPTELLVPFESPRQVSEPYKFSIMLDNTAKDIQPQPLLLAQP